LESLRKFIENYTKLSDEEWQMIYKAFEKREVGRNEVFVEEGKVCRYFFFIEEGLLRFFTFKDGVDITKTFTIAPYCFTSKLSFRNQEPAQESIQAIEKSIVWQMSYSKMNELKKNNSWNDFIRKLIYEVQDFTDTFLMEVRTETAEKRYEKLLDKYPTIIHKIPLKYLSSFLGIAPQSLSRIRKKIHVNRKS
jgi:CRP-like cAMP-binding protein